MIKLRELLQQKSLSSQEQDVLEDILGMNEGMKNFKEVLEKVKHYAKKGLLTAAIVAALASSSYGLSKDQISMIEKVASTYSTQDSSSEERTYSLADIQKIIKQEKLKPEVGENFELLNNFTTFKIYKAKGETHTAAAASLPKVQWPKRRAFTFHKVSQDRTVTLYKIVPQ